MLVKDVKAILYLLWAGAVFVLLIGGLNVANLALARLSLRRRELATRMALGAGRAQLMRQFMVENLLLATASGVSGVILGACLLRILAVVGLNHFPRAYEVRIDGRVVVVAMMMALCRYSYQFPFSSSDFRRRDSTTFFMRTNEPATGGKGTRRLRQGLVVAQIAFAFFLLIGSGLLLASFRQLLRVDPGFRTNGVVTASMSAPEAKYRDPSNCRCS